MKPSVICCCALLLLCSTTLVWAKRGPPPKVKPIIHNGVKYVAPNDDGTRGYVQARDAKTDKPLGSKTFFKVTIDPDLETDVQWVFIKKLEIKDDSLVVTDERDRQYTVKLSGFPS